MLRGVVVRVVVMVIWAAGLLNMHPEEPEVFTAVVLVQVMAFAKLEMVGTEEMGRFVLYGARVVRFLQMQLK
jgi:hypothetical protein